jgi:hypothetical protein
VVRPDDSLASSSGRLIEALPPEMKYAIILVILVITATWLAFLAWGAVHLAEAAGVM